MSDDLDGVGYGAKRGDRALPEATDVAWVLTDLRGRQIYLIGLVSCLETGEIRLRDATVRDLQEALSHLQERFETLLSRVKALSLEERN